MKAWDSTTPLGLAQRLWEGTGLQERTTASSSALPFFSPDCLNDLLKAWHPVPIPWGILAPLGCYPCGRHTLWVKTTDSTMPLDLAQGLPERHCPPGMTLASSASLLFSLGCLNFPLKALRSVPITWKTSCHFGVPSVG